MKISIVPYEKKHVAEVLEFNKRLENSGIDFKFPTSHVPGWLPKTLNHETYQELFVALSREKVVGGYMLKHQPFSFEGELKPVSSNQSPVSEGLITSKYSMVGPLLLSDALKKQPLLYSLGIGGLEEKYAQFLDALRWQITSIPFYFKVIKVNNFLGNISVFKKNIFVHFLSKILRFTGLGSLIINTSQLVYKSNKKNPMLITVTRISHFSKNADELWDNCKSEYSMIGLRDSKTLNSLYSSNRNQDFIKLEIKENESPIGWGILLATQMKDDKYFGDMKVGTLVDGLALSNKSSIVVVECTKYLESLGVDLIVSNQSHREWRSSLITNGFLKGPSNFLLAMSTELSSILTPRKEKIDNIHINRGDGDGPIHL